MSAIENSAKRSERIPEGINPEGASNQRLGEIVAKVIDTKTESDQLELGRQFILSNPETSLKDMTIGLEINLEAATQSAQELGCYLLGDRLYLPEQMTAAWVAEYSRQMIDDHLADQPERLQKLLSQVDPATILAVACRRRRLGLPTDSWARIDLISFGRDHIIKTAVSQKPGTHLSELVDLSGRSSGWVRKRLKLWPATVSDCLVYPPDDRQPTEAKIGRLAVDQSSADNQSGQDRRVAPRVPRKNIDKRKDRMIDLVKKSPGMSIDDVAKQISVTPRTIYRYAESEEYLYSLGRRLYIAAEAVDIDQTARLIDHIAHYLPEYDRDIWQRLSQRQDIVESLGPVTEEPARDGNDRSLLLKAARAEVINDIIWQNPGIETAEVANRLGTSERLIKSHLSRSETYVLGTRIYPKALISQDQKAAWLTEIADICLRDYEPDFVERLLNRPGLFEEIVDSESIHVSQNQSCVLLGKIAGQQICQEYIRENPGVTVRELSRAVDISWQTTYRHIEAIDCCRFLGHLYETKALKAELAKNDIINHYLADYPDEVRAIVASEVDRLNDDRWSPSIINELIKAANQIVLTNEIKRRPGISPGEVAATMKVEPSTIHKYINDLGLLLIDDGIYPRAAPTLPAQTELSLRPYLKSYNQTMRETIINQPDLIEMIEAAIIAEPGEMVVAATIETIAKRESLRTYMAQSPGATIAVLGAITGLSKEEVVGYVGEFNGQIVGQRAYLAEQQIRADDDRDRNQPNWLRQLARQADLSDYVSRHPGASLNQALSVIGLKTAKWIRRNADSSGVIVVGGRLYPQDWIEDQVPAICQDLVDRYLGEYDDEIRNRVAQIPDLDQKLHLTEGYIPARSFKQRLIRLAKIEQLKEILDANENVSIDHIAKSIQSSREAIKGYLKEIDGQITAGLVYRHDDHSGQIGSLLDAYLGDYEPSIIEAVKSRDDLADHFHDKDGRPLKPSGRRLKGIAVGLARREIIHNLLDEKPFIRIDQVADRIDVSPARSREIVWQLDLVVWNDLVFPINASSVISRHDLETAISQLIDQNLPDQPEPIKQSLTQAPHLYSALVDQQGRPQPLKFNLRKHLDGLVKLEGLKQYINLHPGETVARAGRQVGINPDTISQSQLNQIDCRRLSGRLYPKTASMAPTDQQQIATIRNWLNVYLADQPALIKDIAIEADPSELVRHLTDDQGWPRLTGQKAKEAVGRLIVGAKIKLNQQQQEPQTITALAADLGIKPKIVADHVIDQIRLDLEADPGQLKLKPAAQFGADDSQALATFLADLPQAVADCLDGITGLPERLMAAIHNPDKASIRQWRSLIVTEALGHWVRQQPGITTAVLVDRCEVNHRDIGAIMAKAGLVSHGGHVYFPWQTAVYSPWELAGHMVDHYFADQPPSVRAQMALSRPINQIIFDDDGRFLPKEKNQKFGLKQSLQRGGRQALIQQRLNQSQDHLYLSELMTEFSVAHRTIIRDIKDLEMIQPGISKKVKEGHRGQEDLDNQLIINLDDDWPATKNRLIERHLSDCPESVRQRIGQIPDLRQEITLNNRGLIEEQIVQKRLRLLATRETIIMVARDQPGITPAALKRKTGIAVNYIRHHLNNWGLEMIGGGLYISADVAGLTNDDLAEILIKSHIDDYPEAIKTAVGNSLEMSEIIANLSANKSDYRFHNKMIGLANRYKLLDYVKKHSGTKIGLIAKAIGLSPETIRKNIKLLDLIHKNGAVYTPDDIRAHQRQPEPRRIKPRPPKKRPTKKKRAQPKRPEKRIKPSRIDQNPDLSTRKQPDQTQQPRPDPEANSAYIIPRYRQYIKETTLAERRQHRQQIQAALKRKPGLVNDLRAGQSTPLIDNLVLKYGWDDDWPFVIFFAINGPEQQRPDPDSHLTKEQISTQKTQTP